MTANATNRRPPITLSPLVGEGRGGGAAIACILVSALLISISGCGPSAEAVDMPTPTGYVLVKQGAALVIMSEAEKRAQDVLDSPVTLDFQDAPLGSVIAAISQQKKLSIMLDLSLQDEGIDANTPVTVQVKDVPVRSALRVLLRPMDDVFYIDDAVLYLATSAAAEDHQALRFYYVKQLVDEPAVAASPELLLGWPGTPGADVPTSDSYDILIHLIKTMAEPDSWDDVGGPGSIEKLPQWHCLLISQTEAVHRQVVEVFKMLDTLPKH